MSQGAAATPDSPLRFSRPVGLAGQGWILVSSTWLAVAAAAVVAPVAPQMAAYFGGSPETEGLVQLGIGLPALFVALFGALFGHMADAVGRKPVLLTALVAYTICGSAPLILNSLPLILLSRAGVGMSEAAVLATAMALMGDLFLGAAREKWYAIQGATATIAAVLLIAISGVLGDGDWRRPFAIYLAPLILCLLVARFPRETRRVRDEAGARWSQLGAARLARIGAVTFLTAIAFYLVLIQLPFLLVERGVADPRLIGLGTAAGAVSAPLGAYIFRRLSFTSVSVRMTLSFTFSAIGLWVLALETNYSAMLVGAAINGVGSGIALPTLMTWAMEGLQLELRGRMAGFWNGAFFMGQFLSPLAFLGIVALTGSRTAALVVFGSAVALAAVAALASATIRGRR